MALFIKKGLPLGKEAAAAYIAAWQALIDDDGGPGETEHRLQRSLFEHFYGNLNVIDGKANSVIQLNAMLAAAYAVILQLLHDKLDAQEKFVFGVGAAYAFIAVLMCLPAVWLHWSGTSEIAHKDRHIEKLLKIRKDRTIWFRRAWTFSAISLVLFLIMLVHNLLGGIQASTIFGVTFTWSWIKTVPWIHITIFAVLAHLIAVFIYDNFVIMCGVRE